MTLALLQGYVENQGDGWTYTLEYLNRFLEEHQSPAAPQAPPAESHGGYLALVQVLGRRTAELHRALATRTGDPAFDPEPIERADLQSWTQRVREEAGAALDLLERRRDTLAEGVRVQADAVLRARQDILKRIDAMAPQQVRAVKIRHHGDYHLGQVLLTRNDFTITDFEGEPSRSLEERRRKHSPLRDVAGMLRSFNYARYSALARVAAQRPGQVATAESDCAEWETEAKRVFLIGYEEAAFESGLFESAEEARALIELFALEKATYELRYELENRPDWLHVPLRGIAELAGPPPEGAGHPPEPPEKSGNREESH
jgi:maltose alpha-D-glucosyltransferase/alpha-amylase